MRKVSSAFFKTDNFGDRFLEDNPVAVKKFDKNSELPEMCPICHESFVQGNLHIWLTHNITMVKTVENSYPLWMWQLRQRVIR